MLEPLAFLAASLLIAGLGIRLGMLVATRLSALQDRPDDEEPRARDA